MSKASLAHHYDDPKDALIEPHKFMALTHYYVDRWLPELGERGHIIVTVLRRMGYLDRERDVERGGIEIEQEELASLCGLKLRTLQREFSIGEDGLPLNPALHRFVQREQQYHRNSAGRVVREKTVYVVQMRDPLHPSDQADFEEECASREKNAAKENPASRTRHIGGNSASRTRQYGGEARQSDARTRQYGGTPRHIGGNYNVNSDSYIPLLTLEDAGGAPGVSTSSVSEKKNPEEIGKEQPEQKPLPFASLSASEQAPWLDQAEQELRQSFGPEAWLKTGEKARTGIRRQRAASLYMSGQRTEGL